MKTLSNKIKLMFGAVCLFMGISSVQAAPITGSIGFTGVASFWTGQIYAGGGNSANTNLGTANNVTFGPVSTGVGTQSGTFSSVPNNTSVTFNGILFSQTSGTIWSLVSNGITYAFNLSSPLSVSYSALTGVLGIAGSGILSATGYTDTAGLFNLSSQNGTTCNITFSSSSSASAVPIPAALMFVTPALLGVFGVAKKKEKIAA